MTQVPWDKGIRDSVAAFGKSMDKLRARGWPYGAYGDSLQLLKAIELRLAKAHDGWRGRLPKGLKRFILVPIWLWFRGCEQIISVYGKVYGAALALGVLGLFFARSLPGNWGLYAQDATYYLNLILWFTLVFGSPSTYCSAGTNAKHVDTVTRKLSEFDINTTERVERILQNLHVFEERVKRRLLIFRWLLGAGWALVNTAVIAKAADSWATRGASLMELIVLFPPIATLIGVYLLIEAYARGVDIVFRCLDLGCNERMAAIEEKQLQDVANQSPT
jgi:hypothetical protein